MALILTAAVVSACTTQSTAGTGGVGTPSSANDQPSTGTQAPPPALTGTILYDVSRSHDRHATYVMDADGSGVRLLSPVSCCPSVSPDGGRAVDNYLLGKGEGGALIETLDGAQVHKLPNPNHTFGLGAGPFSSTGVIAFEGYDDTKGNALTGVWSFRAADGGGLTRLTTAPGDSHDMPIAWSPDGSAVVFGRTRSDNVDGPADLYVVRADGTHLARLNPPGTRSECLDLPVVGPATWSPDGSQVAFVATEGTTYGNDGSVYVADAHGRHVTAITDPGSTWNLRWSPDGQWIAYDDGDPRTVWVVHPDGSDPHELVSADDGYWSFGPVWSPDGAHVLFMRSKDYFDTSTLWVVGIEGGVPTRLTKRPDLYTAYAWTDASG